MKKEDLILASKLDKEINHLDDFIGTAEKAWKGTLTQKATKWIFRSEAYGFIKSKEFEMNPEIKERVLQVLRDYKKELEIKLESI